MKGCLNILFSFIFLVGILFIILGIWFLHDTNILGGFFIFLFFSTCLLGPSIYYLVYKIKQKHKQKEPKNNENIPSNTKITQGTHTTTYRAYPNSQKASLIKIENNSIMCREEDAIYISDAIRVFLSPIDDCKFRLIINNTSLTHYNIIMLCNSSNSNNTLAIFRIEEFEPKILNIAPSKVSIIEFIWPLFGTMPYGKISEILLIAYTKSYFDPSSIKIALTFQQDNKDIYYNCNNNPSINKTAIENSICRTILHKGNLSTEEKNLILQLKPIKYKIDLFATYKEINWDIDNNYNHLLAIKLLPQYKNNGSKIMTVYYNNTSNNYNYNKGEHWTFEFKSKETINLEVISTPRKTSIEGYNRMIILSLNEEFIDKISSEPITRIITKHNNTNEQTLKITIEPDSLESFFITKLFITYKQAIKECGYNWGEEKKYEEQTNKVKTTECYVYLMHDENNNAYKIGISNNPKHRERTLQSEKPSIILVKSKKFPTRDLARAFEFALHKTYSDKHMRGEWFRLNDSDVKDIISTLN